MVNGYSSTPDALFERVSREACFGEQVQVTRGRELVEAALVAADNGFRLSFFGGLG
jgi:hypothetical protein